MPHRRSPSERERETTSAPLLQRTLPVGAAPEGRSSAPLIRAGWPAGLEVVGEEGLAPPTLWL